MLSWSSLLCAETEPTLSRYLVSVLPAWVCVKENHRNTSLEALLAGIVASCNAMFEHGALRAAVITIRGDWKWLREALHLCGHYGRVNICHLCRASRSDEALIYTDLSRTDGLLACQTQVYDPDGLF